MVSNNKDRACNDFLESGVLIEYYMHLCPLGEEGVVDGSSDESGGGEVRGDGGEGGDSSVEVSEVLVGLELGSLLEVDDVEELEKDEVNVGDGSGDVVLVGEESVELGEVGLDVILVDVGSIVVVVLVIAEGVEGSLGVSDDSEGFSKSCLLSGVSSLSELGSSGSEADVLEDSVRLSDSEVSVPEVGEVGEGGLESGLVSLEPGVSLLSSVSSVGVGETNVLEEVSDGLSESSDAPVADGDFRLGH